MVPMWFLPFAIATRQHVRPEAVGAGAAVAAADVRSARAVRPAAGRRQPRERRPRRRRTRSAIIPGIRAVSFVGSTPVARHVYQRAHARRQARAGARRREELHRRHARRRSRSRRSASSRESFYGCAGERCLAGSVLVPVGEAHEEARDRLVESAARAARSATACEPGVTMGPVISARHRDRVRQLHRQGRRRRRDAARRRPRRRASPDRPNGYFVGPDGLRRGVAAHGDRARGDLRAGGVDLPGARRSTRRSR